MTTTSAITLPLAPRLPLTEIIHGIEVADPYRWLEATESEATRRWQQAQDDLWAAEQAACGNQHWWQERILGLRSADHVSAPVWRGGRSFVQQRGRHDELPKLVVAGDDGGGRVVFDPLQLDPSASMTLYTWLPSWDGRRLLLLLRSQGREDADLCVLDVDSGAIVDGPIDRCRHSSMTWLADGEAFFYVRHTDDQGGPGGRYRRLVLLHRVGTSSDDDPVVFGDQHPEGTYFRVSASRDGRWLSVSASEGPAAGNSLWLADLHASSAEEPQFQPIQDRSHGNTGVNFGPDGLLYLLTNNAAPNRRLIVADPANPDRDSWRELVGEDTEAVIADFAILDSADLPTPLLLVAKNRVAISEIHVHHLHTGRHLGIVPLPGQGRVGPLVARPAGGHEAWFTYTDFVTPVAVYHFDAVAGSVDLWSGSPAPAGAGEICLRRMEAVSRDGTRIPMLVAARKDVDGPRPTILTGYGGFGISMAPTYSPSAVAWVLAGGVYVAANLRGGGERGRRWHDAGRLGNKQNVFDDFIACAEHLVSDGWTRPSQLAVFGGSNGGLLVGAVLTQRPDLFAAAVCNAPLLDMVRYERSGMGATWREEYGSVEDAQEFAWLYDYSPYHHVIPGAAYPATLFTVFDNDGRADPLHARKMCAALQHATRSGKPVVVRREAAVGHDGLRSMSKVLGLTADVYAFLGHHTGLRPGPTPE